MRKILILLALSMFGTLSAQNTPSDLLPQGTEYIEEPWIFGDTHIYVYDVSVLEQIKGLTFIETRHLEYADVEVYETDRFYVRWSKTDEIAEDPREFLHIFNK